MSYIAIIDTGLSNLDSIRRAIEVCGGRPHTTADPGEIDGASHVILPGVGAFPEAMDRLRQRGLDVALERKVIGEKTPFLGICLGMQLLGTTGTEVRSTPGLGWVDGEVGEPNAQPGERLPHIGWNNVVMADGCPLFEGIERDRDFYFVHGYVLRPQREEDVVGTTPYAGGFVSAVHRANVFGVQFHPEKSQQAGLAVLRNFLAV